MDGAEKNLDQLRKLFGPTWNNQLVDYQYFLNESHLAGLGDILKAVQQKIFDDETVDDYDLVEMLKDASEKVTTRKLLLVAHSQGNFYANSFYDKVAGKDGGVPTESIGVYSVATPSSRVAGEGKYLTSGTDKVISGVVGSVPFRRILSPNISIALQGGDDPLGHNFSGVYLKYEGVRIVGDIENALSKLQTPNTNNQENGGCIDPPKLTLVHKAQGVAFAVADPLASAGLSTAVVTLGGINTVGQFVTVQGVNAIAGLGGLTTKTAELLASGVSGLGSLVTSSSAKVTTAIVDTGKLVGKTIAGAFKGSSGQTASVAGVAGASGNDATTEETQTEAGREVEPQSQREVKSPEIQRENPPAHQNEPPPLKKEEVSQNASLPVPTTPPTSTSSPAVLSPEATAGKAGVEEKKKEETSTTTPPSPPLKGGEETLLAPTTSETNTTYIRRTTGSRADTTAPEAPVITSPNANATFTTTSVGFVGTAEEASIISTDFSGATATVTGGVWSLPLTLSQGTTTLQFFATDSAGNRSGATSVAVFVDSVSPDVSLTSSTCTGTLSSSACLVATTTLAFSWSSSSSDVAYFNLDKNGVIATTTDTSISVTGTDESLYTFRVASVDTRGNVSSASTQSVEIFTKPVVVNEIAWAGTTASPFDEWVELYNRTGRDISLANIVFYASDLSPYIPLSGTIGANGYFLIERTDDTTVNSVPADLVAPFSGSGGGSGLNNSGESLLLALSFGGATTTFDTVATCGANWCGGDDANRRTMERYDSAVSGNLSSNWYSHLGEFIRNGSDANGAILNGTPRAKNSVSHLVASGGTVNADRTLTVGSSPYLVNRIGLVVAPGATLTIDPGVVIKIVSNNEPWIRVAGTIHANGTAEHPVVFTSFHDDDYGGDMNANGASTTPSAGNWRRILIENTSSGSSFTNTLVRYAGNNNLSDSNAKKGAIGVDGTTVAFDGLVVEKSNFHGLSLVNSNSTIVNSTFSSSTNASALASGVFISSGSPTIANSVISGNYRGVTIENATPTLTGNTFTGNSTEAMISTGVVGSFSGNSGSGNGKNAIVFESGSLLASGVATTTFSANGLPYLVKGTATVASGATLSFATGVVVKGWDSTQSNNGRILVPSGATLHSFGTTASDIVFTSMRDSSVGGTIALGMSGATAGDWKGIEVGAGGRVHLSGFTLKYAGASAMSFPPGDSIYKGALKITGNASTSSGSISNALFANNYQSGLNLDGVSSLTLSDVAFQNHTEKNMGTASAIYARSSTSTLSNITFTGNGRDGIGLGLNSLSCANCGSPITTPANFFSQ
ncbi:MAG: hypothetical protein Q7R64_01665 [bacterium]|nr:hypothetical protein [bacterium]